LPGTGIIYALTKRDVVQVANWLNRRGIPALAYHSDVAAEGFEDSGAYREHLEERLSSNQIKALVATTALGMGYDKPDLGFVVHYQAPGSIIAYYQQVGRAGRAIDRAVGILLAGREDDAIQDYFRTSAFPRESDVQAILAALAERMTTRQIEEAVNLRTRQIERALKGSAAISRRRCAPRPGESCRAGATPAGDGWSPTASMPTTSGMSSSRRSSR
jgi:ATP-dependent DNA helicase RecQ